MRLQQPKETVRCFSVTLLETHQRRLLHSCIKKRTWQFSLFVGVYWGEAKTVLTVTWFTRLKWLTWTCGHISYHRWTILQFRVKCENYVPSSPSSNFLQLLDQNCCTIWHYISWLFFVSEKYSMIVSHQLCNAKNFEINSKMSDLEHVKLKKFFIFSTF